MAPLQFEWHEEKALQNIAKHGVSFDEAAVVYTERDDYIRIISARQATTTERRIYEQRDT